jgi:glutaredoxin-related protein
MHHIIPRCKKGKELVPTCEVCEGWIHSNYSHNQLRDTYNSVEIILADENFQKFLKWRRKQDPDVLFKSDINKSRSKRKYS